MTNQSNNSNYNLLNYEYTENGLIIYCPDSETALRWLAALCAQELPCSPSQGSEGWMIVIPPEYGSVALSELTEYERINRNWPEPPSPPSQFKLTEWNSRYAMSSAAVIPALLLLWYFIIGPTESQGLLVREGAAQSNSIVNGEWWRAVTALTLHADFNHVFSNCITLAFFGYFVTKRAGPGLGWIIILMSGFFGNIITANVMGSSHTAVGASTAGFGALGACAAFQFIQYYHERPKILQIWHQSWVAVLAALALLGLLGTAPGSDVAAHFFGFISGTAEVFFIMPIIRHHRFYILDLIFFALFFICLGVSWTLAFN